MKRSYIRAAITVAAISFAGLALSACGGEPGQATGGSAPALSGAAGSILSLLVSQVLPLVLGTTGVGGALAGGIPMVLNFLRSQKASASKAEVGVENDAIQGIINLLPIAAQAVKARADGEPGDGVAVLKGLLGQRIQSLDINDDTLRRMVQAAVAELVAKPANTPPAS